MLPPGHIAAGYLVSLGVAQLLVHNYRLLDDPGLIAFGALVAAAPDLDLFYKFFQVKRFYLDKESDNERTTHRRLISHAPLIYLAVAAIAFLLGSDLVKALSIMFLAGTWSHFILDTSGYGIAWLYPFSSKLFTLKPINEETRSNGSGFTDYWMKFLNFYSRRPEFYLEILIILLAVYVFFRIN